MWLTRRNPYRREAGRGRASTDHATGWYFGGEADVLDREPLDMAVAFDMVPGDLFGIFLVLRLDEQKLRRVVYVWARAPLNSILSHRSCLLGKRNEPLSA
jgi:hypothetical protein